jgi:hypothetical protein
MNRRSYLAVGLVVLAIGLFVTVNQRTREGYASGAIEGKSVTFEANDGMVLGTVRRAKYGFPPFNQWADEATVAKIVGERCTGKKSCTIEASNNLFGDPAPGKPKVLEIEIDGVPESPPTPQPGSFPSLSSMYDSSLAYVNTLTGGTKTAPTPAATPAPAAAAATPQPGSFPSLSSMYDSSLAYVNTLTGGTKTAPDSLAAPEPVEFNWPVIGTIIGTVTVLILVTVFYPRSNPVPTGARRVKRI